VSERTRTRDILDHNWRQRGPMGRCPAPWLAVHGSSPPYSRPGARSAPEVMTASSSLMILHAGSGVASLPTARRAVPGLPPGQRVIALREADGMPHLTTRPVPGHSGYYLLIVGLLIHSAILGVIGIFLLIIGAILALLGAPRACRIRLAPLLMRVQDDRRVPRLVWHPLD
jgi:hypothetical protein